MSIPQAEQVVRERLGPDYAVVKLSGYWLVWRKDRKGQQTQSKSLDKAIREQRPSLKAV
jgi:hypothetical protein